MVKAQRSLEVGARMIQQDRKFAKIKEARVRTLVLVDNEPPPERAIDFVVSPPTRIAKATSVKSVEIRNWIND